MSLVEKLLPVERDLFLWLNDLHTPFWDVFMYFYSYKFTWLPLVLVLLFLCVYKVGWKESLLLIVAMVLVGIFCDQISSGIVKPLFERFRPTHHPDFKELVQTVYGYRGGRFGFTSSHASNGWGIMLFTALLVRNKWYTLTACLWVIVTCYSRIYLGVHFITDILGGAIIGLVGGALVYYLYMYARKVCLKVSDEELKVSILSEKSAYILIGTILVTVCVLVSISSLVSLNLVSLAPLFS